MVTGRGVVFIWCAAVITSLLLMGAQTAVASEIGAPVVWATADRPTSYILQGRDRGRGVVDELYRLLHKELPQYQHRTEVMTFNRVLAKMEAGERVCSVGFKKSERERVGIFSQPAILTIPFFVISKKGRLEPYFGGKSTVDLQTLFSNSNLIGAIRQKRSYGEINEKIKHYQEEGRLIGVGPSASLIKMLIMGRVDFVIEIPSFVTYRAKQQGRENEISSYAITDYKKIALIAKVFCTKGRWGHDFVTKINRILKGHINTPEYRAFIERWYDGHAKTVIRENWALLGAH